MLGRGFLPSEDQAVGRDAVVILGHDFWVSQFASSPAAVGSSIWLNGVPCTIVGVTSELFTGVDNFLKPSLFVPLAMSPRLARVNNLERRDARFLTVKGRLKPGVGAAQAQADLAAIAARLEQMYPQTNRSQHVEVQTELAFRARQSPPNAALAAMMFLLSLCVLLVACANVTGLLLSRARARTREMAVRIAIGAGRGRLIRQMLAESVLLTLAGLAAGALLAQRLSRYLVGFISTPDNRLFLDLAVDWRILAFTSGVGILTCLLFGVAPAWRAASSFTSACSPACGRRPVSSMPLTPRSSR